MMEAFVLVVVKPGYEEEVHNALKDNDRIKEIYRVYGEYDLILRVKVGSIEELDRFHDETLRKISNIEMTETLIASSYRG